MGPHETVLDRRAFAVAWSPDGRRIASASEDHTLKIWAASTGQELLTLRGHTGGVFGVDWSSDGRRLASASQDGTVKIWTADGADSETDEHPDVATVIHRRATGFKERGQLDQAEPLLRRALPLYRRTLGADHPWTARVMADLASLLIQRHEASKRAEAQALLTHTLRICDASLSPWDPLRKNALETLAVLYGPQALNDPSRHSELQKTLIDATPAFELHLSSWYVVRHRDRPIDAYRAALRRSEAACAKEPHNGSYFYTLGVAQYRVGAYAEALATLRRSDELTGGIPYDVAFIAMSLYQLERVDEARAQLHRLRSIMQRPAHIDDEIVREFLAEASQLIDRP